MLSVARLREFIGLIDQLMELIRDDMPNCHRISDVTGLQWDILNDCRERAVTELRILENEKYDQWSGRK